MSSQRTALYTNRSKSLNYSKSTLGANLPNPAVEEPKLNLTVFPTEITGSFVSGISAAAFTYILPGSSLSYYHTSPNYSPYPRSSYSGRSPHCHSPNHLHSHHTRSRLSSVHSTHDRPNSVRSPSYSSVHSRHSSHRHHHCHSTQHGHQAYASTHKHSRRDCPHRPQQPASQQPQPQLPQPQQPPPQQVRFETAPASPPDPSPQPKMKRKGAQAPAPEPANTSRRPS